MKRRVRLTLVLMMLVFLFMPFVKPEAAPKKKNVKKITAYVGDKYKLDVWFGGKVTWINKSKKLGNLTSSGQFTCKKPGTATVIGRTKRGDFKFVIKIKKNVSKKLVKTKLRKFEKGAVLTLENKNTEPVKVYLKADFLAADKSVIREHADILYCIGAGETTHVFLQKYLSDADTVDYKVDLKVERSLYKSGTKNVKFENVVLEDKQIKFVAKNNSKHQMNSVYAGIIMYDADKNIIAYDSTFCNIGKAKSEEEITFRFPYDEKANSIKPDSYDLFVKEARMGN